MIDPLKFWHLSCCHVYSISLDGLTGPNCDYVEEGHPAYRADRQWCKLAGSVSSDQKFSYKRNLSLFQAVPLTKQAVPLTRPDPYNQLLIQPLWLVSGCYFSENIKVRVLKFQFYFSKNVVLLVGRFFLQLWLSF